MPSNSGSGEWSVPGYGQYALNQLAAAVIANMFLALSLHCRQHMVAGGVAGSVAVLFLHPFDVIKTRLQGVCDLGPCTVVTDEQLFT